MDFGDPMYKRVLKSFSKAMTPIKRSLLSGRSELNEGSRLQIFFEAFSICFAGVLKETSFGSKYILTEVG